MENVLRGALGWKGERGYSAYEIACKNGFIGTEREWLAQLGTSKTFEQKKKVFTSTASQTIFDISGIYVMNDFVDVYINGFKLNANEYEVNVETRQVTLLGLTLEEGQTVEIVTTTTSANELPIVTNITASANDETVPSAKAVFDNIQVSVKHFGAKGDGVTDDTEAIRAAIESGRYDIFIPEGEYLISKPLVLRTNLRLFGKGTIKIEGTTKTTDTITINNMSNIIIDGLNFVTTLNSSDASEFARSADVLWSNRIALHISESENIKILNSTFTNFEYACKIDGGIGFNKDVLIENCEVIESPMPFYVSYTDGFVMRNCKLNATVKASNHDHHIYGSSYCRNHIIENCEFLNGGGIPIHYCDVHDNDSEEGIYFAENIIVSNISLVETFGGVIVSRKSSYMSIFNIKIKSSREYPSGLLRVSDGASLTVNGLDVENEQSILVGSKSVLADSIADGNSIIQLIGGYANVRALAVGSVDVGTRLNVKNLVMNVVDNIVFIGNEVASFDIENCTFYITCNEEGYPLSVRNADTSMYFVNNTAICKEGNGKIFVYNGENDVCSNFILANNVVHGFATLVHSSATLVKQNNNYSVV